MCELFYLIWYGIILTIYFTLKRYDIMKRLKKSLAFIVSISMLATLSACNSNDKESSKEETTTEATTEEITENIEEYKSKILDFNNNVYEAALSVLTMLIANASYSLGFPRRFVMLDSVCPSPPM